MPYVSDSQRRWAHTPAGTKALGGAGKVAEWDAASKGKTLRTQAARSIKRAMADVAAGQKRRLEGTVACPT
jgi:hypothetical protein